MNDTQKVKKSNWHIKNDVAIFFYVNNDNGENITATVGLPLRKVYDISDLEDKVFAEVKRVRKVDNLERKIMTKVVEADNAVN